MTFGFDRLTQSVHAQYKTMDILKSLQSLLTSVSGPLSAPGQEKETNSWHLLCTTKQHTAKKKKRKERKEFHKSLMACRAHTKLS